LGKKKLDTDPGQRASSQEELSALFVERMRTAMQDNGISAASLARRTGLSKAAISQLMSNKKARLPNSFTIYSLARVLNRNVDYFLGTTSPLAGERATFAIELYHNGFANAERLFQETIFSGSVTDLTLVCDTIPDFLKTEALLVAEYGPRPEVLAHARRMADQLARHAHAKVQGLVLCDTAVVYQLVKGIGLYRALPEADRAAQLGLLTSYFEDRFPDIYCTIVQYRQHQLSPVMMYDRSVLVVPMFGWHMQITHSAMYRELSENAQNAARKGVPLKQYIDLVSDL
jgi:transcriptional regulator with XRE-family HTH domain